MLKFPSFSLSPARPGAGVAGWTLDGVMMKNFITSILL